MLVARRARYRLYRKILIILELLIFGVAAFLYYGGDIKNEAFGNMIFAEIYVELIFIILMGLRAKQMLGKGQVLLYEEHPITFVTLMLFMGATWIGVTVAWLYGHGYLDLSF